MESVTRRTEMDPSGSIFSTRKLRRWDKAEIRDLTDYKTVKESTFQNHVNIWTKRIFVMFMILISSGSSTLQLLSFAKVVRYLNPDIAPGDAAGPPNNCGQEDADYDYTLKHHENITQFNYDDVQLYQRNCFDKTANKYHSRYAYLLLWSFLIPELLCVLNSIYFILFKKAVLPKLPVLLHHCITEVLFAVGMAWYTFFAGPYLPYCVNIIMSLYPVAVPLSLSLTENTKKYRETFNLIGWIEENLSERFEKLGQSIGIIIRLFSIVSFTLGLAVLCLSVRPIYASQGVIGSICPPSGSVLSITIVMCSILLSIPAWVNYALVSGNEYLRHKTFELRGYSEFINEDKNEDVETTQKIRKKPISVQELKPRGYEWAQLVGSLAKILVTYIIYISCLLTRLNGQLNEKLFTCPSTALFSDELKNYDVTVLILMLSTAMSSYCAKLSCRVNIQCLGFYLPTILSTALAYTFADLKNHDVESSAKYLPSYIFGLFPLILITTHLWSDEHFPYQLERHLFTNFSYKPIFSPIFSMMNRRIIDMEVECKNINLKRADDDQESLKAKLKTGLRRLTGYFNKTRTTYDEEEEDGTKTAESFQDRRARNSFTNTHMLTAQQAPMIYICTTLWHEEDFEMATLVRSVLKLMKAGKDKREKSRGSNKEEENDSYNLEMHVFFDNVFEKEKHEVDDDQDDLEDVPVWAEGYSEWKILNKWVVRFHEQLKKGLRLFHDQKKFNVNNALSTGRILVTPYGGRIEYDIAGTLMIIHLKDAEKVQSGKRWSQVMYLYYLIGWKIDACGEMTNQGDLNKDRSFILALDGDVDFDPPALDLVLHRLLRNENVAACCGQIHPKGTGYLVAYQRFEYAVGHWLQKTAEHVLGCVLCSPGCFSLMRMSHLAKPNVMAMYKSLAKTPLQKLQYDQGEDRWLCTLMLTAGGRIEFEASSHCNTFAPDDLATFYKQRRRWGPSTTANVYQLIQNQKEARKNNQYISLTYVLYHLMMLIFSLIGVSTTVMMVAEAFHMTLGYNIGRALCYTIVMVPVVLFSIGCLLSNDQELQLSMAKWLSLGFSFIMASVLIGLIIEGVNCPLAPSFLFFMALVGINVIAALAHLDLYTLVYGIVYFLFIPSCFIFLQIYAIANLNDVSWGTRQGEKKVTDLDEEKGFFSKLFGIEPKHLSKKNSDDEYQGPECSCILCPKIIKQEAPPASPVTPRARRRITSSRLSRRSSREIPITSDIPSTLIEQEYVSDTEDVFFGEGVGAALSEKLVNVQSLESVVSDKCSLDYIQLECDFGGLTVEELRQTNNLDWTLKMTNYTEDGDYLLERNVLERRQPNETKPFRKEDLARRELAYFETNEIDYMSWILSDKSPVHKNCKVHILSNPEFRFWRDMVDQDSGHIGIKQKGRNQVEIANTEARVIKELDAFRTEMFMYFLFINALWMIVTSIILLYAESLLQIEIEIPDGISNCGEKNGKEEDDNDKFYSSRYSRNYGYGDYDDEDDNDPTIIKIQPFSIIFLLFYIILIVIQFFCMLWHRLSTFYHYVAFIHIHEEKDTIEKKKYFNKHAEKAAVIESNRASEVFTESKKINDANPMRKSSRRKSSKNYNLNIPKRSTVMFEGDAIVDCEERLKLVEEIIRKRSNRKSSVWLGSRKPHWVSESSDTSEIVVHREIEGEEMLFQQVKPKSAPDTSVVRCALKECAASARSDDKEACGTENVAFVSEIEPEVPERKKQPPKVVPRQPVVHTPPESVNYWDDKILPNKSTNDKPGAQLVDDADLDDLAVQLDSRLSDIKELDENRNSHDDVSRSAFEKEVIQKEDANTKKDPFQNVNNAHGNVVAKHSDPSDVAGECVGKNEIETKEDLVRPADDASALSPSYSQSECTPGVSHVDNSDKVSVLKTTPSQSDVSEVETAENVKVPPKY